MDLGSCNLGVHVIDVFRNVPDAFRMRSGCDGFVPDVPDANAIFGLIFDFPWLLRPRLTILF